MDWRKRVARAGLWWALAVVALSVLSACESEPEATCDEGKSGADCETPQPPACTPSCKPGWECGSDGCEGVCGTCSDDLICTGERVCSPDPCDDACLGRQCGPDTQGCGKDCGTCAAGDGCDYGKCVDDRTFIDEDTGLMWRDIHSVSGEGLNRAQVSCVPYLGYEDWRLPTIDELRTLVRGCPSVEPSGSCGVTTTCLEPACVTSGQCTCAGDMTKTKFDKGCFGHPKMVGQCAAFWSSSQVTKASIQHEWWVLDFYEARVFASYGDEKIAYGMCVRGKYEPACAGVCGSTACGVVNGCTCGTCPTGKVCSGGACVTPECTPSCVRIDGKQKICGSDGCGGICGSGWAEQNGYDCVDDGCCHVFLPGCFNGCDPKTCCPG